MNIVNDSKFSEWLDTIDAKESKRLPKFGTVKSFGVSIFSRLH